jgi:hypothetical protein
LIAHVSRITITLFNIVSIIQFGKYWDDRHNDIRDVDLPNYGSNEGLETETYNPTVMPEATEVIFVKSHGFI